MNLNTLMTNSELDNVFREIQNRLDCMPTPDNFSDIYDFTKRYANQFGFGTRFVEKIYLLGYIKGTEEESKKLKYQKKGCEKKL